MMSGHWIWIVVRLLRVLAFLSHLPDFSTVKSNPSWESYEPAPGSEKPLPRARHVSVTTGERIIMFVSLFPSPSPLM